MIGIVAEIIVNGDSITADALRSLVLVEVEVIVSSSRCAFNCKLFLGDATDGVIENDTTRDIKTANKEMTSLQWQRMDIISPEHTSLEVHQQVTEVSLILKST